MGRLRMFSCLDGFLYKIGIYDQKSQPTDKIEKEKSSITSNSKPGKKHRVQEHYWIPTAYEKDLLRRTWSEDFDFLYIFGLKVLEYLLDHYQFATGLFPRLTEYGDKWRESDEFRAIALKVVQPLSIAIEQLDDIDRIKELLVAIGERHVQYKHKLGFNPSYWDAFPETAENSLAEQIFSVPDLDEQQKQDAVLAWRKFAHFIVAYLKKGFAKRLEAEKNSG